jgi:hypothetical protein
MSENKLSVRQVKNEEAKARTNATSPNAMVYYIHPTYAKAKPEGDAWDHIDVSNVTGLDVDAWFKWMRVIAPKPEFKKMLLEALWLQSHQIAQSVSVFFRNSGVESILAQIMECDVELLVAYVDLVKEGCSPRIPMRSPVLRAEMLKIVKDIDMREFDLLPEEDDESDAFRGFSSARMSEVLKVHVESRAVFDAYESYLEENGPVSSDQIAWDMGYALVTSRRNVDVVKLSEIDSFATTVPEAFSNPIIMGVPWKKPEWLGFDQAQVEVLLCLYDYGEAFRDLASLILHYVYLVRQGWRVPEGKEMHRYIDPVFLAPMLQYYSSMCSTGDLAPHMVNERGSRIQIRVPKTWVGKYLFVSQNPQFPTSRTCWPALAPIVDMRDDEYVLISMQKMPGCSYVICANGDFELVGVLCLADAEGQYNFGYYEPEELPPQGLSQLETIRLWRAREPVRTPFAFPEGARIEFRRTDAVFQAAYNTQQFNRRYPQEYFHDKSFLVKTVEGWMLWAPLLTPFWNSFLIPRIRVSTKQFAKPCSGARPAIAITEYVDGRKAIPMVVSPMLKARLDPEWDGYWSDGHASFTYARLSWFFFALNAQERSLTSYEHVHHVVSTLPFRDAIARLEAELGEREYERVIEVIKGHLVRYIQILWKEEDVGSEGMFNHPDCVGAIEVAYRSFIAARREKDAAHMTSLKDAVTKPQLLKWIMEHPRLSDDFFLPVQGTPRQRYEKEASMNDLD